MNEWAKAQAGYLYDANHDPDILNNKIHCADLCFELNQCRPSEMKKQQELLRSFIGNIAGDFVVATPFYCDYGCNISFGKNFYCNYNCFMLDAAKITFGDNVFIAPNCVFSTAGHPIDKEQRAIGLEIALPITVGDDVWFGASVTVLPGVTIGSNCVIGAGSVVNKDIPSGVVAAGNPCRVIRPITEKDKEKYPIYRE